MGNPGEAEESANPTYVLIGSAVREFEGCQRGVVAFIEVEGFLERTQIEKLGGVEGLLKATPRRS